ncbi:DUF4198 domain-containing protein [Phaeobacter gallaeciensis]|uniref:DUF4198 domain-containing protein n=1 Tax=Phaeobacter gallaeciensis TaxID=60890 RepID=UPI00238097F1|nr:DUF4198 domain-containing protein [Phaeobacter gallaeciensis]MDE4274707.1 DUF4198 domain-containing protein [Phaeobacter gallaeciensis]MDE4299719.1 DUF4198 domain-containing protein [Phaeobacter gallaeciensis]MDE5184884.1 DUF4198 domain-containing protein [Phaeobacter gallaeciensis]
MKNHLACLLVFAFSFRLADPALSHEFWIEPQNYQVESGEELPAQLLNGQEFKGFRLPYFKTRTKRSEVITGDTATPYEGRMGDLPALTVTAERDGLLTLVHETMPETLTYETWEKFDAFAEHKGFADIRARHEGRGLPVDGFTERYSRHAKSLIAVGSGAGSDRESGMETEFVALENPYTFKGDTLPVQLFYQQKPRAAAQVEIFERAPDDSVTITLTQTDAAGRAEIPVKPGHTYLLDAVVLRPSDPETGAVWETLWAGLTFAVP